MESQYKEIRMTQAAVQNVIVREIGEVEDASVHVTGDEQDEHVPDAQRQHE